VVHLEMSNAPNVIKNPDAGCHAQINDKIRLERICRQHAILKSEERTKVMGITVPSARKIVILPARSLVNVIKTKMNDKRQRTLAPRPRKMSRSTSETHDRCCDIATKPLAI